MVNEPSGWIWPKPRVSGSVVDWNSTDWPASSFRSSGLAVTTFPLTGWVFGPPGPQPARTPMNPASATHTARLRKKSATWEEEGNMDDSPRISPRGDWGWQVHFFGSFV